jgi:hypothetical protein
MPPLRSVGPTRATEPRRRRTVLTRPAPSEDEACTRCLPGGQAAIPSGAREQPAERPRIARSGSTTRASVLAGASAGERVDAQSGTVFRMYVLPAERGTDISSASRSPANASGRLAGSTMSAFTTFGTVSPQSPSRAATASTSLGIGPPYPRRSWRPKRDSGRR